jgi:DnaJ domain
MPKANADRGAAQTNYEILGVATSASHDAIRAAYRALARKYHPDVNPSSASAVQMAEINGAYQTLIDPARRAAYDRELGLLSSSKRLGHGESGMRSGTTQRVLVPLQWSRRNTIFGACLLLGIVLVATTRYVWLEWTGRGDEFSLAPSVSPATDDTLMQASSDVDPTCADHPLACPAGTRHYAKLEQEACQQWCSDPHGNVVARSTITVTKQPPKVADLEPPLRTQQFWNGRLICNYRFGLPSACSWQGASIELGRVSSAAIGGWRVSKAEGAAHAAPGDRCDVFVAPFEPDSALQLEPNVPPYNCRVTVRCGSIVYGAPRTGYCLCDVHKDQLRGALDARGSEQDGDPALALDLVQGRASIAGANFRLSLTRKP